MYSILGRGRKRLFNEIILKQKLEYVIISEGEWDCMLVDQYGYYAITSTGGASSFDKNWVEAFEDIKKVYICYDQDRNLAGQNGLLKTAKLFTLSHNTTGLNKS